MIVLGESLEKELKENMMKYESWEFERYQEVHFNG